jgi:hypothetical protein
MSRPSIAAKQARPLKDINEELCRLQLQVRQTADRLQQVTSERESHPETIAESHALRAPGRDWGVADESLANAEAIIDLLQGAAAHGAIEEPANNESLARALSVVRELLEDVRVCLWPRDEAGKTEDAS